MREHHLPIDAEFTAADSTTRHAAFVRYCTSRAPPGSSMADYTFELADEGGGLVKDNIRLIELKRRSGKLQIFYKGGENLPKREPPPFSMDDYAVLGAVYNEEELGGDLLGRFITPPGMLNTYACASPLMKEHPNMQCIDHMDPEVDLIYLKLLSALSPDVAVRENALHRTVFDICMVDGCSLIVFIDNKCIMHSHAVAHGRSK
jgi:hypothetical protein